MNGALAAIAGGAVGSVQPGIIARATRWVEQGGHGLVPALALPPWAARGLGVILLDYTLWHWHRLCHVLPRLWRLHAAHHADLDLDASTALRFHFGELLASVPIRFLQIVGLGIDRATLRTWETAVVVAILVHHSNVRLPYWLDGALGHVIITPRLHGIHHAVRPYRLDRNFGTLLSIWDRTHGTRSADPAPDELAIGLEVVLASGPLGLLETLAFPLRSAPPQ
ncbi:MAG: sterol desaturase family protein [Kofleriaceae bacterium]